MFGQGRRRTTLRMLNACRSKPDGRRRHQKRPNGPEYFASGNTPVNDPVDTPVGTPVRTPVAGRVAPPVSIPVSRFRVTR